MFFLFVPFYGKKLFSFSFLTFRFFFFCYSPAAQRLRFHPIRAGERGEDGDRGESDSEFFQRVERSQRVRGGGWDGRHCFV